jgi:hypothetical protein
VRGLAHHIGHLMELESLLVVCIHYGVLGNEVAIVDIVFERDMWNTKRSGLMPSEDFLDGRAQKWRFRHVL